jgi:hypothetical protein
MEANAHWLALCQSTLLSSNIQPFAFAKPHVPEIL